MKFRFLATVLAALLAALAQPALAQDKIYRCGNEYTNDAAQARERGCKQVQGGNVTVLESTPKAAPAASAAPASRAATPANAPRVSADDQRARDADARAILEAELRKTEARAQELRAEYNGGTPNRTALELRNPQGYAERTAEIKAQLDRAEADAAGIRRELDRLNK
ncbi:hypothetical protein GCM10022279_32930 [Comamonas faecalis]|uniref:Uncharacterized protein n=1 Tax=Comamonas faecalis TaxID=1387849 RepID=A0ABP7S452_9BURK